MNKEVQRLDEWIQLNDSDREYHLRQWRSPNRSTEAFADFIANHAESSRLIVDLGCGAGGATNFLSKRFENSRFLGLDISSELIQLATNAGRSVKNENLTFGLGDMLRLPEIQSVDGVISLQTWLGLPSIEPAFAEIATKLNPRWIAGSSLFYDGEISCRIEVNEHSRGRTTFYNTYSVPMLAAFAGRYGMELVKYQPFIIDIDLPRPASRNFMSSYTVETHEGRMQFSGPLLMNWGFVLFART